MRRHWQAPQPEVANRHEVAALRERRTAAEGQTHKERRQLQLPGRHSVHIPQQLKLDGRTDEGQVAPAPGSLCE